MTTSQESGYVPTSLPDDVLWGFTREGLRALRHYCHPIPHSRGLVGPFMTEHWPGLTFESAMSMANQAGALVRRGNHFTGLDVPDRLKELHLLVGGASRVIWFEEGEPLPTSSRENDRGGLLVQLPPDALTPESNLRDVARVLLERLRPR